MAPGDGGARIPLEPLTPAAFAPFGEVLAPGPGGGRDANLGTASRHDRVAALESTRAGAKPNLAIYRSRPQELPLRVTLLERHPHSTQVFAALHAARWLVIVAPDAPDGGPDPLGLRAFVAGPGDAFNYRRGLWHHPIIVLDEPAELLMLAWEDGGAADCEERPLAHPVLVG
jgi:ureidoglycolate lyase